jgi:hypothetical protein
VFDAGERIGVMAADGSGLSLLPAVTADDGSPAFAGDAHLRRPIGRMFVVGAHGETPAGIVQPTGAKIEVPTADFWYLRDGKIATFDCYVGFTVMFAQMGVMPDFASAVAAPVAAS